MREMKNLIDHEINLDSDYEVDLDSDYEVINTCDF